MILKCKKQATSKDKSDKSFTTLKVVLFSEIDRVSLNLKITPYCMNDLVVFTSNDCFSPRFLRIRASPCLSLDWSCISIKVKESGNALPLPTMVPLPFFKLLRVRSILRDLTHFQLLAENGKTVHEIFTWHLNSFMMHRTVRYSNLLAEEMETDIGSSIIVSPNTPNNKRP